MKLKNLIAILVLTLFVNKAVGFVNGPPEYKTNKKVLVYIKNGKGYVHDNRQASVDCIKSLGKTYGFDVDASDDPNDINEANLKKYAAIILSNTNNETFDTDAQKLAFQRFVLAGGGLVGIHSASGSERQWPWFASVLGGRFKRHPPLQPFDIKVIDPTHPSTKHLKQMWKWEDECYYLDHLNPGMNVLLAVDLRTINDEKMVEYPGATFGNLFPLCWSQNIGMSRQWYTALGHKIEYYSDPTYQKHLAGGITWVLEGFKGLKYGGLSQELMME